SVQTGPRSPGMARPTGGLGRAAVGARGDRIGGGPPKSVTLPARLVVRRSCGESAPQEPSPTTNRRQP
ncbi:LacI family transcriptional regulator, partial [Streptomyces sp. PSKA30]|nr:LacI family transcriptional regulator [Streptomyces sp. PSKA30]